MKIEMKGNVVTITSSTKKEAKRMVEFYYGMKQPEKIIERVIVKEAGPGRGKYKRRAHSSVDCPKCGKKTKGLKLHDKIMHQGQPAGWGSNPGKRKVRELLPA